MRKKLMKGLFCIILVGFMSSCATSQQSKTASEEEMQARLLRDFNPEQCAQVEPADEYVQKINNLIIIFDPSASMLKPYKDIPKQKLAKDLLYCMNRSIPDLKFTIGLRVFGSPVYTSLVYGLTVYSKEGLEGAIESIKSAKGASPLAFAVDALGSDLNKVEGKTAVIIISDGMDMGIDPLLAVKRLKSNKREDLCFYTVLIGDDPDGKLLLGQIAEAGGCGFATTLEELVTPEGMDNLVKELFFRRKIDSDKDGIEDDLDKCPGTPKGASVDDKGCWLIDDVLFDFDKAQIKSEYFHILEEVAEVMKQNPALKMEIDGHTDIIGPERYNNTLSIRRARAGRDYLADKGISPDRITIRGFGYSQPKTTNETDEGRAKNRRIVLKPNYNLR